MNISKQQIHSIKEVDEGDLQELDNQGINTKRMALMQKDYCRMQIMSMWSKYDIENCGMLDKIESANFLTEILTAHGLAIPTMDQINKYFNQFDENKDGQIMKKNMTNFVMKFVTAGNEG